MTYGDALANIAKEAVDWRRQIHQQPELLFDLPLTSALVAEKLKTFGCDEVATGIAKSGVVGVVRGRLGAGPTIALRADMDALPMAEQTNLPYASRISNMMHACGHDGHTAMLLGAAKHLAATRDFAGTVVLVFQPAEEGGAGARVMIEEGMLERFGIDEVYGMHNQPGRSIGCFATRPGAIMAAGDRFMITLNGRGGHAASPHETRDSVLACSHLVTATQSIASRHTDPFDPVVVSMTYIAAGAPTALNVIPASVTIGGTIRTISPKTRADVEKRFRDIVAGTARLFDIQAEIDWRPGYPVTVNDPPMTEVAVQAASAVAGSANVEGNCAPTMGAEDFSYLLEQRPGAIVWIGNGDSAGLHHPAYDFNDDAIIHGLRYWTTLIGQRLGGRP